MYLKTVIAVKKTLCSIYYFVSALFRYLIKNSINNLIFTLLFDPLYPILNDVPRSKTLTFLDQNIIFSTFPF